MQVLLTLIAVLSLNSTGQLSEKSVAERWRESQRAKAQTERFREAEINRLILEVGKLNKQAQEFDRLRRETEDELKKSQELTPKKK